MNRPDDPLKAQGALTYLEFIELVKHLWANIRPDIPIYPTQGKNFATYPCISYGLEYRKTIEGESKKRIRHQSTDPTFNNIIARAQRYENYVSFSVYTDNDPLLAENIIEEFENFMDEYTGVFKELGLSEILYGRRFPDRELNRESQDTCIRAVGYLATIEKVTVTEYERLRSIVIDARLMLAESRAPESATPDYTHIEVSMPDTYAAATPNY